MSKPTSEKKYRLTKFGQVRDGAGITLEQLAEATGIKAARIARAERGTEPLERDEVVELVRVLSGERHALDPADVVKPWKPRAEKVRLPGFAALLAASGLARFEVAERAKVGTWVTHGLAKDEPQTRRNTQAVLDALIQAGVTVDDPAQALVPQRYLPNCRTLREWVHWSLNRLAKEANVERDLLKELEAGRSAPADQSQRIFDALYAAHADLGRYLSAGEIGLSPEDDPFPPSPNPPVRLAT